MTGKTVVVTGGNTGVGFHTAAALRHMGADVVLTARDPAKGQAAVAEIEAQVPAGTPGSTAWQHLDLASFRSIESFAERFADEHDRIDVLVNNAGALLGKRSFTEEGFEATFGVNHLGHFLLTQRLLPLLRAQPGSRIVNVASEAHRAARGIDFDDIQRERSYKPFRVYAESKLMNILFTRELARRLADVPIHAFAVHPGVVASRFAQDGDAGGLIPWFYRVFKVFMRTPEQGARGTIYLASAPSIEGRSGGYFVDEHEKTPSRYARDDALARRLWEASEAWVAARHP
ncbi:MAG: SDR family oxidoreductase [Deltaproteobacteria bacterium]|nr:MAG: SDR family oxidoreductase [Deltaproteobacteria bacterium]